MTSSTKYATAAATASDGGGLDWDSPTYAEALDGNYATDTMTPFTHGYLLKLSGYGFAIPVGATITGIVVEIYRYASSYDYSLADYLVKLLKAGSLVGNSKASASNWPTSVAWATYGGSTDLWGTTWTPAEINASGFGVGLQVGAAFTGDVANVDTMRITVYYTEVTQHKVYVRYVHLVK